MADRLFFFVVRPCAVSVMIYYPKWIDKEKLSQKEKPSKGLALALQTITWDMNKTKRQLFKLSSKLVRDCHLLILK